MKVNVDLAKFGEAVDSAPVAIVEVVKRSASALKKSLPLGERIAMLADKSLEDIEQQLELDENGKSKISESTRQRYNLWLVENHPDAIRNRQTTMEISINAGDLKLASGAAKEMDRRKAIEASYKEVSS